MVSGTRAKLMYGLLRTSFILATIVLAAYTTSPFFELNQNVFHYQNPSGFFIASWAEGVLAWVLALIFWSGILFGALGRRIDYILVALFIIFGLWNYFYTDNVTPQMYLGLFGVALLGNAIGYMLKLARLKWFER